MNYWLVTNTGRKYDFYTISDIFSAIEEEIAARPWQFHTRSVMATIDEDFAPQVVGANVWHPALNTEAFLSCNVIGCRGQDEHYKEYVGHYRLATRNCFIVKDIHGYVIPKAELARRYAQRFEALYEPKRPKRSWARGCSGFKSCKNRQKRMGKFFNSACLIGEYKAFTSQDENDLLAPVRPKRLDVARWTCARLYDDYGCSRQEKSWKAKKKRKQWMK